MGDHGRPQREEFRVERERLKRLGEFRHYHLLVNIFVIVLLVSNLVAGKICRIGPFTVSGAQLLFPVTYIFGDIFTEVYGYAGSRRAIWVGFLASVLLAAMGIAVVALPPAPEWHDQEAFAKVFGFVPRIVVASLAAYWAGEFTNSLVMAKMKLRTGGRHLWMRTIGSTVVGQAVDTGLFMVLIFAGIQPVGTILQLIVSGYFGKVAYEALATPVTYAVVNALKRSEGVDVFDRGIDFSPFRADA
jgi:uncharacterized integral membrane protein (TIGR00697 family)